MKQVLTIVTAFFLMCSIALGQDTTKMRKKDQKRKHKKEIRGTVQPYNDSTGLHHKDGNMWMDTINRKK